MDALEERLDAFKQYAPSNQESALPAGLNIEHPDVLLTPGTVVTALIWSLVKSKADTGL